MQISEEEKRLPTKVFMQAGLTLLTSTLVLSRPGIG